MCIRDRVIDVKFIEFKEIEKRDDGLWYRKTVETPYSGGAFTLHSNGKKKSEAIFKDGLLDGVMRGWYANDQKGTEINYKNGKIHGLALLWQIYDQEKNVLVLACTYQENSKILL